MAAQPSQRLSLDVSKYTKLDRLQAGHLRHFHNLAAQIDGEWNHMGCQEPMQEFLDAYRYQLATMAYAAGAAHYHRLPALRSTYKSLLRRLIYKMLRREVWGYWFTTSLSGNRTDPDRTELRTPWADPVVRENIMYSGHLLLMTSLYAMLFDDDEFEKKESLAFLWNPLFWGFGPEKFAYDNRSLQGAIIKEMERNNWIGVCCEPNLVFIVCNQFPIIAMRYNDVRDGTNVAGEVLEKYKAAWDKKGMVSENGLYVDWFMVGQDRMKPPMDIGFTAWANAFMNSWNSELVQPLYERQVLGYITSVNKRIRLQPQTVATEYRKIAEERKAHGDDADILAQAQANASNVPASPFSLSKPTFGYVVQWLSEVGKTEELQGILEYADEHLKPTWERGGLFYPRNDARVNEGGEWAHMDPFSGNAAIGYSRLNVPNGQKIMWEKPWTREHVKSQPWIDGLDLAQGIDCTRGEWDAQNQALILTMSVWDGSEVTVEPVAKNLSAGVWAVYINGGLVKSEAVEEGGDVGSSVVVGGHEIDVVFIKT